MKQKLKLCIFENGVTPAEFVDKFGYYPAMIENWLKPFLPNAEFTYISPVKGEPLPLTDQFDGYILSGSAHSSYEKTDWMQRLIVFLQQLKEQKIPVFGICFGHQLMADAYGGQTTKAQQGWGIGAQTYNYQEITLPNTGNTLIFHQDQVTTLPPDTVCIGGSSHCINGVLKYNAFPALSVQFHPEFTASYVDALVHKYRQSLPENVAEKALSSLQQLQVNNEQIGQWAAQFFKAHSKSSLIAE